MEGRSREPLAGASIGPVKLLDTTDDARRAQFDALRRLTPQERVRLAVDLSEELRGVVAAGVRDRHPEWGGDRVRRAVLTRLYGEEFVKQVWGSTPDGA